MSRSSLMTWGLLLILVGVQLNLVESFVLSPRATQFWNNRVTNQQLQTVPGNYVATSNGYFQGSNSTTVTQYGNQRFNSVQRNRYPYSTPNYQRYPSSRVPVYQSSYATSAANGGELGPQKMLTPPTWFCWPPIFLGSVLFLYGAASRE